MASVLQVLSQQPDRTLKAQLRNTRDKKDDLMTTTMNKQKIAILSVSAGAGHVRAAQA